MTNEITVAFHNGSNYDHLFITKELANEFEEKFEFLRENTKKYTAFSVSIKKEVAKIDKDRNKF